MQLFPFILVIISAITHGVWNFLAKQSDNKDVFIGLSKIAETAIFLIPFLFVLFSTGIGYSSWYVFVTIAACFVFLNYYFLSQAYKRVELSVAYPISRSSTLFLPFLGYFFIGERIDGIGIVSILLITVGVFTLQLNSFSGQEFKTFFQKLARPGIVFALLAALTAASYTLWDKVAVTHIPPFLYFYSYTALTALFYLLLLGFKFSQDQIKSEWEQNRSAIILVAILNTTTYLLVLSALSLSKATYVGGVRQLSLVIGVVLGWRLLKEPLPLPKLVGVLFLIVGSTLIAFAN